MSRVSEQKGVTMSQDQHGATMLRVCVSITTSASLPCLSICFLPSLSSVSASYFLSALPHLYRSFCRDKDAKTASKTREHIFTTAGQGYPTKSLISRVSANDLSINGNESQCQIPRPKPHSNRKPNMSPQTWVKLS